MDVTSFRKNMEAARQVRHVVYMRDRIRGILVSPQISF